MSSVSDVLVTIYFDRDIIHRRMLVKIAIAAGFFRLDRVWANSWGSCIRGVVVTLVRGRVRIDRLFIGNCCYICGSFVNYICIFR